jgi:hypothetical protein
MCCVFGVGMMKNSPTSAGSNADVDSFHYTISAKYLKMPLFKHDFSTIWNLGGITSRRIDWSHHRHHRHHNFSTVASLPLRCGLLEAGRNSH